MIKIYDGCYFSMPFLGKIKSRQPCVDHQNVFWFCLFVFLFYWLVKNKKRSWNYLQYTIERKEIEGDGEKERCKRELVRIWILHVAHHLLIRLGPE